MNSGLRNLRIKIDPKAASASNRRVSVACGAQSGLLPVIALAWCIGSVTGLLSHSMHTVAWLFFAAAWGVSAVFLTRRLPRTSISTLLIGVILVAAARAALATTSLPHESKAALEIADGRIVRISGSVLTPPQERDVRTGLIEHFGHVPTSLDFQLDEPSINSNVDGPGQSIGRLLVRVNAEPGDVLPIEVNDRVSIRGRLRQSRPASNPGEQLLGPPLVWLDVPDAHLVHLVERPRPGVVSSVGNLFAGWRMLVREALDFGLGRAGSERARALVRAIVLGIRSDDFDEISTPYRRTGLAHYLAVSGFALGVLVAIPALLLVSRNPILRGMVVIIVVTGGLAAIDVRAPALRAGLVACAAALGVVFGRSWNRSSLLALAAIVLLAIDPREIFRPGFQLSFSVVAALLLLAPVLARRLPGAPPILDGRISTTLSKILRTAVTCGIVAWLAATPIVLHHFGIISPLGIALSVLAAPLVAGIVALAIAAICLAILEPMLAVLPGTLAAWMATLLDECALVAAALPGSCFVVPTTSAAWTICAEILLWRWILHSRPIERTALVVGTLVLLLVPFTSHSTLADPQSIQLLTLDVGNGSCHVVSGPHGSVLLDAGSSSIRSTAHRVVVPALHSRGIRTLDAVIVTHANLDHFAAVGDLLARVPIGRILIGESFIDRAQDDPDGAASRLLELAREWSVPIEQVHGGDTQVLGGMRWRFLHPEPGSIWTIENDTSLVVRVENIDAPPDVPASILFTGDIEEHAMKTLLATSPDDLAARIVEAPHHGSVRPSTASFLECTDPELIVQSTGQGRLALDRLGRLIGSRRRMVTALHGAISVRISSGSDLDVRCFQDGFGESTSATSSAQAPPPLLDLAHCPRMNASLRASIHWRLAFARARSRGELAGVPFSSMN